MKKFLTVLFLSMCIVFSSMAQNVGISINTPSEKLHVDSGRVKIGRLQWNGTNIPLLMFGDGNYITIGEEEADDKLTIKAKELFIRPSNNYPGIPVSIQGSSNYSHFYFGANEDTYIRGGKTSSNVIIGDGGGRTGVGVYPTRAGFEQSGSVSATAAIFGGSGTGISLQQNWPAIGFNSYLDAGGHKAIGSGFGAQLGLDQGTGSLYLTSLYPYNGAANTTFGSFTRRFYISREGKIGIGADLPYADMEITQRVMTYANEDVDAGITYNGTADYGSGLQHSNWNTHIGYGQNGQFASLGEYSFWNKLGNNIWANVAAILTSGDYYQSSDEKLKKDIQYLGSEALSKIMLLKPASYRFKKNPDNAPLSFGFIAQDIEKIFPEIVINSKTNKLMCYTSLIPVLTKGIQEQQQQIEYLRKENAELKIRMEKLEKLMLK